MPDAAQSLAAIKDKLSAYAKAHGNQLLLDNSIIRSSDFLLVLSLLKLNRIEVPDIAKIGLSKGILTIAGSAGFYGSKATMTLTLQKRGSGLDIRLEAALTDFPLRNVAKFKLVSTTFLSPSTIPDVTFRQANLKVDSTQLMLGLGVDVSAQQANLFGKAGVIELKELGFSVFAELKSGVRKVEFDLSGSLKLGSSSIQATASLPVAADSKKDLWTLTLEDDSPLVSGLSDLTRLIGGVRLDPDLPSGLNVVDHITLSRFSLQFNPVAVRLLQIDFRLVSKNKWTLAKNILAVAGAAVQVTIGPAPAKGGKRDVEIVLSATLTLGGVPFPLTASKPGRGKPWVLSAQLGSGQTLPLPALAKAVHLPLPHAIDVSIDSMSLSVTPQTESFSVKGSTDWKLGIGAKTATISAKLDIESAVVKEKRSFEGSSIGGEIDFGGVQLNCAYDFGKDFVVAGTFQNVTLPLADIGSDFSKANLTLPFRLPAVMLEELDVAIDVTGETLDIYGDSSQFGGAELLVGRFVEDSNRWEFAIGFNAPSGFDFTHLSGDLKFLNGLDLSSVSVLVSSADEKTFPFKHIKQPANNGISSNALSEGLEVAAAFNFGKTALHRFLTHFGVKLDSLSILALLPVHVSNLALEGILQVDLPISDAVTFTGLELVFKPAAIPPSLMLDASAAVTLRHNPKPIDFTAGIAISADEAGVNGSLVNTWNEPFGFQGVQAGPASLVIDIDYEGIPGAGIAGTFSIGKYQGSFATKFDPGDPAQSLLTGSMNLVPLGVLVSEALSEVFHEPPGLANLLKTIEMKSLDVQIVPQTTTIGTQTFQQGFRLSGELDVGELGFTAQGEASVVYSSGITVKGSISPMDIARGLIKIEGTGGAKRPGLDLEITRSPLFRLAGSITALKVTQSTFIDIDDKRLTFSLSGKYLNLFQAEMTLQADPGNLANASFAVGGALRQDFFDFLMKQLVQGLLNDSSLSKAIKKIRKAIGKIDDAQKKVDGIERNIRHLEHDFHHTSKWDFPKRAYLKGRIEAEKAAKTIADKALDLAKDVLRATIGDLGLLGVIGDFIVNHGTTGLVNVTAASFSGQLERVDKGSVSLSVAGTVAGKGFAVTTDFNFLSPANGIKNLVERILKG